MQEEREREKCNDWRREKEKNGYESRKDKRRKRKRRSIKETVTR